MQKHLRKRQARQMRMDKTLTEKLRKVKEKLSDKEFRKKVSIAINPEPIDGSDYLVDYMARVLLFLFPLYMYEADVIKFMGVSVKDILFGVVVAIMSLWCGRKFILKGSLKGRLQGEKRLIIIGAFVLVLICFIVQPIMDGGEVSRTYYYMLMFLVPFCMYYIKPVGKYYLQILLASYTLIFLSIYRYVFTGAATIIGAEVLLDNSGRNIPALLLICAVSAFLYVSEDDAQKQKVYLVYSVLGFILLFLYGDMLAFMTMLMFILFLQFIRRPIQSFIKRNMIILFVYAFCASNAPLLSYFEAKGITKTFDLEYSIYIDILIAVAGLAVTSYWDRIPKEYDEDHTVLVRFSKWYRRSILLVLIAICIAFTYGTRVGSISSLAGGKAISGFFTSIINSANCATGELWNILMIYGAFGLIVVLALGAVAVNELINNWKSPVCTEVDKGYILLALLFIFQGIIYPFSGSSLPEFLVFFGLAITCRKKMIV